jgi:hypothetical protein
VVALLSLAVAVVVAVAVAVAVAVVVVVVVAVVVVVTRTSTLSLPQRGVPTCVPSASRHGCRQLHSLRLCAPWHRHESVATVALQARLRTSPRWPCCEN